MKVLKKIFNFIKNFFKKNKKEDNTNYPMW
jgi:hypothetical protein